MNPPAPQRNFAVILGLLALSGLGLFLLKESLQNRAALTGLRLEADGMRGRLEAKDETVGVLKRELHRLQRQVAEQEGKQAEDPRIDSLLVTVGTLSGQQSNLFSRIDGIGMSLNLGTEGGRPVSIADPEQARATWEDGVVLLNRQLDAAVRRVESAETLLADQADRLQVPVEFQELDPGVVLSIPAYQKWWPYFQVREEFDVVSRLASALRLRVEQETIDSQLPSSGLWPAP